MNRLFILAAGVLAAGAVQGAPFGDPMRPPAALDAAGAAAASGPRVESILIAPDRRIAVINGTQVTVGGRIATGQVVRITETEVVIRGAEGEQTLKLFPDVPGRVRQPDRRTPK